MELLSVPVLVPWVRSSHWPSCAVSRYSLGFYGFLGVSLGLLWVSMGFHGPRGPMYIHHGTSARAPFFLSAQFVLTSTDPMGVTQASGAQDALPWRPRGDVTIRKTVKCLVNKCSESSYEYAASLWQISVHTINWISRSSACPPRQPSRAFLNGVRCTRFAPPLRKSAVVLMERMRRSSGN